MTNLDSILKSRDITLPTKVCLVKAMVFQWSCMYVRVELWRKLRAEELILLNCGVGEDLRVPWTAKRYNQSILEEISPGRSLGGLMLKLKLGTLATSCEELTHWKRLWCWEGLGAGGKGDDGGLVGWLSSPIRTLGVGDGQGGLVCCNLWGRKEWDMTEWLNWTESWFQLVLHPVQCFSWCTLHIM